ncbi:MAG: anthranilate phosphoribosyltransferase [Elusimicrobiota bacterium]|nr:anthranilate phosphoribosyltransferase [Elusimicrobiota bacterium]
MIKEAIQKAVNRQNLSEEEATAVMTEIMSGQATEAQISSYITALRMKGETVEEITGSAKVMRKFAVRVERKENIADKIVVDTCGTGGDGLKTFNISTMTAFVVAGAGILVAKHGNRSVSSACGSADVIEKLGIKLELTKEKAEECLSKVGIVFLFAPLFHTAMKYAITPRRQIGIRTIFNVLGPLCNPAEVDAQLLGVYSEELCKPLAEVLKNLGVKHAFVVHGTDGLDEISTTAETKIAELKDNKVEVYNIKPEYFGIKYAKLSDLAAGDVETNVSILLDVLKGKKGPQRDIVLLNSSAVIVAAGKARDFHLGIKIASESIDSGKAFKKLEELKEFTSHI